MNTIKKAGYAIVPTVTALSTLSVSADMISSQKSTTIGVSQNTADVAAQNIINNAMIFLTILAVAYGIYGGFLIMTAGTNEDNVKKGRSILMYVGIGIVVIWLAGSIVKWVMGIISGT